MKWELYRLSDGKWSVRYKGTECFILPELDAYPEESWDTFEQRVAGEIAKLLNELDFKHYPTERATRDPSFTAKFSPIRSC